jgi:hypothetical protein
MKSLSKGKTALVSWLNKMTKLLYKRAKKEVRQIRGRPKRMSPLEIIHSLA